VVNEGNRERFSAFGTDHSRYLYVEVQHPHNSRETVNIKW
jgi:hypothetical protein